MAQNSWPFHDGGSGTPVLEDQWTRMSRQWATSGVVGSPSGAALQVYADNSGREVHVRTGQATVRGHWYENDAELTLAIAANGSGNPRIDRVVLRLDPSADSVILAVVGGTPAGSPVAPSVTLTDTAVYELPLADVLVGAGVGTLSSGNVTDRRSFASIPVSPATSTRPPHDPTVGQTLVEVDTGRSKYWTGDAWLPVKADEAPIHAILPAGSIIAYGGTSAPTGWKLCDGSAHGSAALQALLGSANTPDLRGRFILGVSGAHPRGDAGGSETHTLSVDELPSHDHGGSTGSGGSHAHTFSGNTGGGGGHNHSVSGNTGNTGVGYLINYLSDSDDSGSGLWIGRSTDGGSGTNHSHYFSATSSWAADHSHYFSGTTAPAGDHGHTIPSQGGGGSHNNMPPFYALVYIIKAV